MKLNNTVSSDTTWEIYETELRPEQAVTTGSNYMIGNGYYGYRGTFADATREDFVACVLTDTYDNADGIWKELSTVPNGLYTAIRVDGSTVRWMQDRKSNYRRTLNFRYGEWSAEATWQDHGITMEETRFSSMTDLHLLASRTAITAHRPLDLEIVTGIDGDVWSLNGNHFRSLTSDFRDGINEVICVTQEHGYEIVVQETAVLTDATGNEIPCSGDQREDNGSNRRMRRIVCSMEQGRTVVLTKYVVLYGTNDLRTAANPYTAASVPPTPAVTGTLDPAGSAALSRRAVPEPADPDRPTRNRLQTAASEVLRRAERSGWEALRDGHRNAWDRRWASADISIKGDDIAATVLRYNLYHNMIATPGHTDHLPIGARGLSCQAYQGAAFWDQEIFNLPMFLYTQPEIARNILVYRYRTLDGARRKARDLGYSGAFYPWISGDSGEEICPAYFFRDLISGRRIRNHFNDWQIHISPDITYAISRYVTVTGDEEYLKQYGAEIAFEVARFLYSRALFRADRDRYEIIRVLGPDEYHENVDNNFFTNFQTRFAVSYACEVYRWLGDHDPDAFRRVTEKINLQSEEVERWNDLADKVFVPQPDGESGIIEQFVGYFQHENITPEELKSRLINPGEYWGWPNGIAVETQVTKQADVTQLFMLHPDQYNRDIMRANWEYYEPRTQHGSSLSPAVYAIVAAWIDRLDDAYRYFMKSCTIDLYNDNKAVSGGTFIGGIHTAACGAGWQIVVSGFAGLTVGDQGVRLTPRLPAGWDALSFSVVYRGSLMTVEISVNNPQSIMVTLGGDDGNRRPVPVNIGDRRLVVEPGETVTSTIACVAER